MNVVGTVIAATVLFFVLVALYERHRRTTTRTRQDELARVATQLGLHPPSEGQATLEGDREGVRHRAEFLEGVEAGEWSLRLAVEGQRRSVNFQIFQMPVTLPVGLARLLRLDAQTGDVHFDRAFRARSEDRDFVKGHFDHGRRRAVELLARFSPGKSLPLLIQRDGWLHAEFRSGLGNSSAGAILDLMVKIVA